jgi:catechol 2,3-dioxygenase-like lactoylglutathione lyase family enzyme
VRATAGTVVLGAEDVERAVAFWANVFGYEAVWFPRSDDDFTILIPPDRNPTRIAVHRSITPVQERPREHLDLVVDNSTEQSSEIERLLGLGATRVPWDDPVDTTTCPRTPARSHAAGRRKRCLTALEPSDAACIALGAWNPVHQAFVECANVATGERTVG